MAGRLKASLATHSIGQHVAAGGVPLVGRAPRQNNARLVSRSRAVADRSLSAAVDTLAGLLGLELDEAHGSPHLDRDPAVGLAFDFSTCYDRLLLSVLRKVAARAGVGVRVPARRPCIGLPLLTASTSLQTPLRHPTSSQRLTSAGWCASCAAGAAPT